MPAPRHRLLSIISRLAVGAVVLAVALAIFAALYFSRPQPVLEPGAGEGAPVRVMQAHPVPVQRRLVGYGTARAMDAADVPARVGAVVEEIPPGIDAGAAVQRGDLIVRLDPGDFQRQVEIAEQSLADLRAQLERLVVEEAAWTRRAEIAGEQVELAEAELERARGAMAADAARQREVDVARQALLRAVEGQVAAAEQRDALVPRRTAIEAQRIGQQAALRQARENLERTSITAPISGVLQSVDVEVGENVAPGQRVARVVALDRIEVPLRLPASARGDLTAGDTVLLEPAGAGDQRWTGVIDRIAPEVDPATRTMAVFVEVVQQPGGDGGLLAPGTFVLGTVSSGRDEPRWVVPRRAVEAERIRVVERGILVSRPVEVDFHVEARFPQLGVDDTQWAVLGSALEEGQLVLINAARALPEGTAVQPVVAGAAVAASAEGAGAAWAPAGAASGAAGSAR